MPPPAVSFLREVVDEWQRDRALTLGAALAYYTIFSLAPLLVLVIAVAGLAFGRAAAQGEIVARIGDAMGPEGARMIEGMIVRASAPGAGIVAGVTSLVTMAFGASGVVAQLQASLNLIWGVPPTGGGGVLRLVRQRASSLAAIVGIGALLFLSVVLSAALAAAGALLAERLPVVSRMLPWLDVLLSIAIVTALFAMIYKTLPDVVMRWRDVWVGALVTALLFTLGKSLIGLYLGRAGVTSVYGAAGSLVLVLLWVYYSAQILLIGAEFTEVYSRRYGSRRAVGSTGTPA
jgi:membrane protein